MAFFLHIKGDKQHWGGNEGVMETFAHIPMCTAYSHIADDGKMTQPMGLWVLGSGVKANYVAAKLRKRGLWIDRELMEQAGQDDVAILVYTDGKMYLYNNSSRMQAKVDVNEGYLFSKEVSQYEMTACMNNTPPPQWGAYTTDFMLV